MVYTPEEEEKWAEGEIKVIDGKRYKVSYEVLPTGDVQMLLEEIEKIIGHDKMAELLDVPKELYASVIDESAHDCFLIEKRELLSEEEEEIDRLEEEEWEEEEEEEERKRVGFRDIVQSWGELELILSEEDKQMLDEMEHNSTVRFRTTGTLVSNALGLLYLNKRSKEPINVDFRGLYVVVGAEIIAPKRYADWFSERFKGLLEEQEIVKIILEEEEHEKQEEKDS